MNSPTKSSFSDLRYALTLATHTLGLDVNDGKGNGWSGGYYTPLVKRRPLMTSGLPKFVKQNLQDHKTCACTDDNYVYVGIEEADEFFKLISIKKDTYTEENAVDNFRTILAHEYTHILMDHVERGKKFVRQYGDKFYPIFAYACDIEANRGYEVCKHSRAYAVGVTDDAFPLCKGINGLMNIYRVLKDNYADDILKNYNDAKDENEAENNSSESNSKSESSVSKSSDGESEKQTTSTESKSKSKSKSEPGSHKTYQEQNEDDKEAHKQIVSGMEEMKRQIERGIKDEDEELKRGCTIPTSKDLEDESYNLDPYTKIRDEYLEYKKEQTDLMLNKVKGLLRGNLIRDRVETYSRQSRKSTDGLMRKGTKLTKSLSPRTLVAMDSSGSMDAATVTDVAAAIGSLAQMLGKTKGSYICKHDDTVKNLQGLSKWKEVVDGFYAYGGNNFDAVLEKALELKVEMVLNIGDGMCYFYDNDKQKRAKKAGLRWIDVLILDRSNNLRNIYTTEKTTFGDDYMGREMVLCC